MNDYELAKLQALIGKMRDEAYEIDLTLSVIQREFHEFPIDEQLTR
ncbi:MAG: hypothetical protein NTX45_24020 [Proteobacteria bacterium]|nr:hypothetical protein [Pseudomonadota bacterium]